MFDDVYACFEDFNAFIVIFSKLEWYNKGKFRGFLDSILGLRKNICNGIQLKKGADDDEAVLKELFVDSASKLESFDRN